MTEYNGVDVTKLTIEEINNICIETQKNNYYSGIIYCYTNKLNGKKYIGQTLSPMERHYTHISSSKLHIKRKDLFLPIHNSIRKYGIENFTYSVLCLEVKKTKKEYKDAINNKEQFYIAWHNTTDSQYGYNIKYGGHSCADRGIPVDQYTKFGEYIRSFNSFSEAIRITKCKNLNSSVCKKQYYANGYVFVPKGCELPTKIFEKYKNLVVHQYSESGKYIRSFDNTTQAAASVNGDKSRIDLCSKKPLEYIAYGFRWSKIKKDQLNGEFVHYIKPVYQYDKNGNYVAGYENCRHAARSIGCKSSTHISVCVKELWRKAKGYYWRNEKHDHIEIVKRK